MLQQLTLTSDVVGLIACAVGLRDVDALVAFARGCQADVRAVAACLGVAGSTFAELKGALLRREQRRLTRAATCTSRGVAAGTRFRASASWVVAGLVVRDARAHPWVVTAVVDATHARIRPLRLRRARAVRVRAWEVRGRSGVRYVLSRGGVVTGDRFVLLPLHERHEEF
jgi:hypothetical protein